MAQPSAEHRLVTVYPSQRCHIVQEEWWLEHRPFPGADPDAPRGGHWVFKTACGKQIDMGLPRPVGTVEVTCQSCRAVLKKAKRELNKLGGMPQIRLTSGPPS